MDTLLVVLLLLACYLIQFAALLAAVSFLFWLLARLLDAHTKLALALSIAAGILSTPMVESGHGVAFIPLAFGMFADHARFSDNVGYWIVCVLSVPIMASIAFLTLNRISKRMLATR